MKIRVRNRVTGKEYECREDDFLRAKRKGAALVRLGVVKEEKPSFLTEDIEDKKPEKPKRKPRKKNNQNDE